VVALEPRQQPYAPGSRTSARCARKEDIMSIRVGIVVAVATWLAVSAGSAAAQSKCSSAKAKTAGKHAAGLGKCRAKAIGKGTPVDPACTTKENGKVAPAFGKAEAKGDCLAPGGDGAAISAKDAALVDDVHQAVNASAGGPSKCDSKKVQVATKKAADKAGCHAKAIGKGIAVDAACLGKAETKFSAAVGKAEAGTDCTNTGQAAALEAIVDAYVADLVDELTVPPPTCCVATRMETASAPGILAVGTLPQFPFPSGIVTKIETDAGDASCKHSAVIPAGGFTVPAFCIPALGFTSEVTASGCESGNGHGAGMVWDAAAPCADADVSSVGDTSDPSTNACGTLGTGCGAMPGQAGADTAANVDTTLGNTACDAAGVGVQLAIPVHSTTWNDVDANCPDDDGVYDPGTDVLVSQFDFILRTTTASSNADYTDLNADSCAFAGHGPDHTKRCSLNNSRPCTSNGHCTSPLPNDGTCTDGPLVGVPAAGPCCQVGQTSTLVATGFGFTGGAPLYDIIFANRTPTSVTSCVAPTGGLSCTPTTNVCLQ
jgi:hypothetical protein